MSQKRIFNSNSTDFYQCSNYLNRPRLQKILKDAIDHPMVAVYAGSGYGKTQTVYSFLRGYSAHTTWIQLSERDNMETRFWENYAHMISLNWPDVGARLMEIGFPDTDEAFAKYASQRIKTVSTPGKYLLVYDDFHLLNNLAVLRFFERAANSLPPNVTIMLLSRTMPEINIAGLMLRERVYTINENTLCFTEDEIAEYFKQLALSFTRQDIRDIYEDTRGWAFAINLIGRSLCKAAKYERYALEAMKTNIFRLMGTEIPRTVSVPLWRFLLRISLIDHLAVSLIKALGKDDNLIREMELLNAYIRYDFHLGAYMIHHLFLDYLRRENHILTDEERRETYQEAGAWCEANGYQADALSYYEKSGDYGAIMRIVYSFNVQMPQNIARYTLEIFNRIPEDVTSKDPLFPAMKLKLKISLGLLNESSALAEQYVREYETRPESPEKNRALAEILGVWAVLRMVMCPYTDTYDFDVYYEKQRVYYDKNPYTASASSANQLVGPFALLIGTNRAGAPEEYIEAVSRAIPHASHVLNGNMSGFDDLARGELFYYKRELHNAEQYLQQALGKARARNQYDIQNRALIYLMLINFARGDIVTGKTMLQSVEALLDEKCYATRYEAYDIARSFYYMAFAQPERVPDWLKEDFSSCAHPLFLENYANRIKAQYRYATRQHNSLLAFLENARESQALLIGKIVFKVLEALSLHHLKRRNEAIAALTDAYRFAEPNRIIVPFTQYSKDMRTLTAAALKDDKCSIPKPWLKNINRKASAFAKRQAYLTSSCRMASDLSEKISLTKREMEVLKDMSQGLSRSEIATSQNISINTVKMVINKIYDKLNVNGLTEAIRAASDLRII